jgi:hypothetical protein
MIQPGSCLFTWSEVTDHSGLSDTEAVTVPIIAGPALNFAAPPAGWTNTVYSDSLTESGGSRGHIGEREVNVRLRVQGPLGRPSETPIPLR